MKRLFVLLISICLVACLFAAPSKKYKLVVKTTDSEYSYALYKQPEISFTNTDMVIKMDQEDVRFAKSDIVEFLFDYNQYKVTFLDWDGDTLQSSMVTYGEYPSYNGATPERESDNRYTYTFSDWSPELDIVTEDVTYIAQYQEIVRYEVAFYNWDGTLLQSNWYDYGEYPSYTGETPIREADTRYTYTFSGWNPQLDWVTGNQAYYAQYHAELNQYEITFYDWDGTLLQSTMVNYGEYPSYESAIPTREADAQYTYTFIGWGDVSHVTGHASYYAQYHAELNQYEINFYNWDGTLLQSEWVNYGEWPTYYNSDPWREADAQYTYTFNGWSPQLDWVTGHQSYYAQYEATLNQYEINFYDWNGTLLQSSMVNYGEWPTYYNSEPTREADAQYTYTFSGWSPQLDIVTGHQSYYAQYESTLNQYEINFYDWDGTLLQSNMVDYGEWPMYYNSDPWREADAQYTYTFTGWSPQLDIVTGHQSYYAQYESTINQYEITFYDWDGTLLQSTMVNYGEWPTYYNSDPWREADAQYTYSFSGWSPQLDWVSGNQSYYAQYESTLNQYQITFYDWNGIVLQSELVNYGEMPTYTGVTPTREADTQYTYTFTGWSPELSMVTGHLSYYAQYESTLNQYEVTFYNWNGEVLQSTMVDYGAMPEYFGVTPTKPEDDQYVYTFSGWEPEITIVVAYAEYTAQYDATDKVTTAIQNTQSDEVKTYKILRNNKIFIIRGDKVYSILGHVIEDWMPLGL